MKKFFDIFPPEMFASQPVEPPAVARRKEERKIFKKELIGAKPPKPFWFKAILILIGIFIFLLGGFFYFKLPRLDLEIWPKTEFLSLTEQIVVDKNAPEIDLVNKVIPGKILEEEKELWQEFQATGKTFEEGKARGTIRVYNKYNPPTPMTLKATTRFLSDSGKLFLSPQKIYIPAAKIEKGKVVPSWTEIEVVAAEAGEDYNIGPANFSVPGLAGTPYYYAIYGESQTSMTGGFKKEIKQVTEEDIQKAQDSLTKRLLEDIETSLKNKVSSEFILLDTALSKEIVEVSSLVKAGAVIPQFNFQAKAKGMVLIFKKSDLEDFAKKSILSQIPVSKKIFEESLTINYTAQLIDLKEGKITLNLKFSAIIYPGITKEELTALIKGKSAEGIREIVYENFPEVSQIKINFRPFWVKKTPKNIEKINIKLNFE